jgi:tRNA(Ile)-lysidine synthase TilS/MesJ
MKSLGIPYWIESDAIVERAKDCMQKNSICSFCSRMKRGMIYNCARREGYNVIAMGQHLDDLAESFVMSSFHNGVLRTMKANYTIDAGDLRVIRPLVTCREALFRDFSLKNKLPVVADNCPACFSAPKERHRIKLMLAQQEHLFPNLFQSILKTMIPLMSKNNLEDKKEQSDDEEFDGALGKVCGTAVCPK